MKRRSTEYDAWLKFHQTVQPPTNDQDFAFFVNGKFKLSYIYADGDEISATYGVDAESFDMVDGLVKAMMEKIRDDYGNGFDYSDPHSAVAAYHQKAVELSETLAAVMDKLRSMDADKATWSDVYEIDSMLNHGTAMLDILDPEED